MNRYDASLLDLAGGRQTVQEVRRRLPPQGRVPAGAPAKNGSRRRADTLRELLGAAQRIALSQE